MGDFRKKYPTGEKKFLQGNIYLGPLQMVGPLVPRPMWSERKSEAFPARSPRIRHRGELTEKAWKNALH